MPGTCCWIMSISLPRLRGLQHESPVRERGREGEREGGRERKGGREREREREREGERVCVYVCVCVCVCVRERERERESYPPTHSVPEHQRDDVSAASTAHEGCSKRQHHLNLPSHDTTNSSRSSTAVDR